MKPEQLLITNRRAVRELFGKKDSEVTRDVEILFEWLKTQQHLPETPTENMVELFLTMNKFSIERTKKQLDMYYTIRSLIPEFYANSNPRLLHMTRIPGTMGIFVALPKQTPDFHRVYVLKIMGSPDDFDGNVFYSHILNVMEVRIQHDISLGDIYLVDYQNLKMGHVLKITPIYVKKVATIWEKVLSNRVKSLHVVNHPAFMDVLMTLSKAAFSPKIFSRIHLHSGIESVYDFIPREMLPSDYGGDELSVEELSDCWKTCLSDQSDRFDLLETLKVKEEFRPIPLENDEILGYHGNFKQLEVD